MKKSLKFGLFSLGFLLLTTGCAVNYCSDKDVENISNMYKLKTSIYIVDQTIEIANKDLNGGEVKIESSNLYDLVINKDIYEKIEKTVTDNAQTSGGIIKGYLTSEGIDKKIENNYYLNIYEKLFEEKTVSGKKTNDFQTYYPNLNKGLESQLNEKTLKSMSACLTIDGSDKEPTTGANLEKKDWGYAWKKSPLQALITYPIALGLTFFTNLIGASGVGQIFSILLVTIIVRLLLTAVTFKSTMQQQKMTLIQPEMSAIQVKYQGKTDQVSKQKMSQEMMKVYQKYGVNPLSSILMPFLSMPVFMCVYYAVNNTAILKTGEVFGVNLGAAMSTSILGLEWSQKWFAILLFALMIIFQFVSMKIPQWIQNHKNKNRRPDPRIAQTQKQTNMMTTIFFVMIIFMGWMLPTAMTVYWIASSFVSIVQTLGTQYYLGKKSKSELIVKK